MRYEGSTHNDGLDPRWLQDTNLGRPMETQGWARSMIVVGIVIFLLNMAGAWWVAVSSLNHINQPYINSKETGDSVGTQAMAKIGEVTPNGNVLLNRLIEAEVHYTTVRNRQAISVIGIATGFGLIAVGFSLTIMGIKSSFEFAGSVADRAKLILRSSSPGILCFVLATVILVASVLRSSSITFGKYDINALEKPVEKVQKQNQSRLSPTVPEEEVDKVK